VRIGLGPVNGTNSRWRNKIVIPTGAQWRDLLFVLRFSHTSLALISPRQVRHD
jgi:hypothetical protein